MMHNSVWIIDVENVVVPFWPLKVKNRISVCQRVYYIYKPYYQTTLKIRQIRSKQYFPIQYSNIESVLMSRSYEPQPLGAPINYCWTSLYVHLFLVPSSYGYCPSVQHTHSRTAWPWRWHRHLSSDVDAARWSTRRWDWLGDLPLGRKCVCMRVRSMVRLFLQQHSPGPCQNFRKWAACCFEFRIVEFRHFSSNKMSIANRLLILVIVRLPGCEKELQRVFFIIFDMAKSRFQ